MIKVLLDKHKGFYKANLHCHSTNSDGYFSPQELKEQYLAKGYSVVAFSDHEHLIDNSYLNDEHFVAITACELAIKEFPKQSTLSNQKMRVCHLNLYALNPHNVITPCYSSVYDHFITEQVKGLVCFEKEYNRVYSQNGINEMIKIAKDNGFLVCYNHPTWSLETALDYLRYESLFAVEIYNTGCIRAGLYSDDEHVFDDMLRAGKQVFCICADDNHEEGEQFGGWVYINADRLDYESVMGALKNGEFYASTGPQILSLVQEGELVRIQTSPCKKISLITAGRRGVAKTALDGEYLSGATFDLHKGDEYFRIRILDEFGHKAYTQAYEIEKMFSN